MRGALGFVVSLIFALVSACSSEVEPLRDAGSAADAQAIADGGGEGADAGGDLDAAELGDAEDRDAEVAADAAPADATPGEDAAVGDAAAPDATPPADATAGDATPAADAQPLDAAPADAQPLDAAPADAQPLDATAPDAAPADAQPLDAMAPDAQPLDAAAPDAATPDSGVPGACNVALNAPDTYAGQVGANGGSPAAFLDCGAGEEPIGVAVRISNQNTANGGLSAVGFTLACAQVSLSAAGPTVSPETLREVMGSGMFGWSPATQSTITLCSPGWLVSGLSVSRGTTADRFLDVTLTCAELLSTGVLSGATQDIYVMGSQTEGGPRDTVECPSGQVVRRLGTRTGAGFDAASLYCAIPTCGP